MNADKSFEAEVSRTTGPTMAAAVVEFFKKAKGQWLITGGQVYQVLEVEATDSDEDGVSWSVWTATE